MKVNALPNPLLSRIMRDILKIIRALNVNKSHSHDDVPMGMAKISLVISQKDEFQNGGYKKAKNAKFSEKRTFLNS